MTAATPGPSGQNIFSQFSGDSGGLYRTRRETFVFSLIAQAAIVVLLSYFTRYAIVGAPPLITQLGQLKQPPLVFSGKGGGGGGSLDKLPPSHGDLPKASLEVQIVPPTVMRPTEMPKLAAPETVVVAPEVKLPQGGPIGDPLSQFSRVVSGGPGGPGGWGKGCCNGVGPSKGPSFGTGPSGIYPAGAHGVTVPQAIYDPEPSFSEEARKSKQQGMVTLLLVVGSDGHPYDIRVRRSLGMGLDEKAVEAVNRWRFKPATYNGQAVATQIEVEVDFRLF